MHDLQPDNPTAVSLSVSDSALHTERKLIIRQGTLSRTWAANAPTMEWLHGEVGRLKDELDRLQTENQRLREEVTLVRLIQDVGLPEIETLDPFDSLPAEARNLLKSLPDSFRFSDYFQHASHGRMSYKDAKEYLRIFLRDRMLIQKGTRIEKPARSWDAASLSRHSGDSLPY